MLKQSDKFVNLLNYGAADLQSNFLPYKWKQATTADGKSLIGLGSDIGGLAMCYRTDLFAKAGLPTDRDAVSAMWKNSWDDYIATGLKFKAANPGASFMDSATNNFNAILMQTAGKSPGYTYFDTSGKLVVDSNPAVKTAWNETNKMITDGLSAGLQSFADAWTNGFKQSKFATVACPAWMTGVISGDAGDAFKGKWDIATVPGGGGNWGGSFLAVPKQSKHQAAAVDLVKFLTSKEGQIAAWNAKGNLPSNPQAEQDSSVLGKTDPYFNNAPTGKIFATGAASLTPVYLGPANQAVRDQVENSLRSVEQGQKTADQAWTEALANASKAAQ
jgi:cellobiose transport system substrate-binding protein